jgi:hypothetical protein
LQFITTYCDHCKAQDSSLSADTSLGSIIARRWWCIYFHSVCCDSREVLIHLSDPGVVFHNYTKSATRSSQLVEGPTSLHLDCTCPFSSIVLYTSQLYFRSLTDQGGRDFRGFIHSFLAHVCSFTKRHHPLHHHPARPAPSHSSALLLPAHLFRSSQQLHQQAVPPSSPPRPSLSTATPSPP